jgi:hypothetical protein
MAEVMTEPKEEDKPTEDTQSIPQTEGGEDGIPSAPASQETVDKFPSTQPDPASSSSSQESGETLKITSPSRPIPEDGETKRARVEEEEEEKKEEEDPKFKEEEEVIPKEEDEEEEADPKPEEEEEAAPKLMTSGEAVQEIAKMEEAEEKPKEEDEEVQ